MFYGDRMVIAVTLKPVSKQVLFLKENKAKKMWFLRNRYINYGIYWRQNDKKLTQYILRALFGPSFTSFHPP
jgi:hypothetical protein